MKKAEFSAVLSIRPYRAYRIGEGGEAAVGFGYAVFNSYRQSAHKPLPEDSPEPGQRLEMLKLASRELSGSIVSDMEIERGSFSYTADTLKELIERYPDTHFWLIMGGDMFLSVEQWYRADYIFRHSSIAVFARARDNEKVIAHMERLNEKYGVKTEFIKTEPYEISSTELRNMLKARGGLKYLQSEVYAYIVSNRIYGVKPDFGWLLGKSLERHDAKRIPHVLGTESEAVKMAERWGCDPDEARPRP
jgi:nicotinate-nucleotide adenylyltransferase